MTEAQFLTMVLRLLQYEDDTDFTWNKSAELAEKLGVSELMPLFCELDEVMITLQHGVLHRKQTLANGGEYCDYFIMGNKE